MQIPAGVGGTTRLRIGGDRSTAAPVLGDRYGHGFAAVRDRAGVAAGKVAAGQHELADRVRVLERALAEKELENESLRSTVRQLSGELLSEKARAGDPGTERVVCSLHKENEELKKTILALQKTTVAAPPRPSRVQPLPGGKPALDASFRPREPDRQAPPGAQPSEPTPRELRLTSQYDEVALFEIYCREGNLDAYAKAPKHDQPAPGASKQLPPPAASPARVWPGSVQGQSPARSSFSPAAVDPSPVWDRAQMVGAAGAASYAPPGGGAERLLALCPAGPSCLKPDCGLLHANSTMTDAAVLGW
ncbi:hypothetical protein DIPPA_09133 [Diplonema papillatum]|nr:hypothetical protein DIPPA_09133 [Diplonema papillatum]